MANPTPYQSIIDIDGLREQIRLTKADTEDWVSNAKALFQSLFQESEKVKNSLGGIKFNVGGASGNQLTDYAGQVQDLTTKLNFQRQAMDNVKSAESQLTTVQQSLAQRTEELLQRYAELNGTSGRVVQEKKRIAAELVNLQSQFDRLDKVISKSIPVLKDTGNTYTSLSKQVADWRRELKNLENAFDPTTGKINKLNAEAVDLADKIQKGDKALKSMSATMGNHQLKVGSYSEAINGAVLRISQLTLSFLTLDKLVSEGKAMIEATKQAESLSSAMLAVHTSADEAARSERFIYSEADRLGAEVKSNSEAFVTLAGATRGSALEGQQTRRIWDSLVTAGVAMHRSNEEIERSVVAVGQIFSKQKVQAEELSGQLAEALPGSLQILAKELGLTTSQLLKMASNGELLSIEVLPKLADGLEKAYSGTVVENSNTLTANTNRLNNAIQQLRKTVFEETGLKSWFSNLLTTESQEIKDWIYLFKNWSALRDRWKAGNLSGNSLRETRLADEMQSSTYDSFRQLSTSQMQKTIDMQSESDMTTEQRRHLRRLREIYQERLDSEKKLADETAKTRWEQGEKQREKEAKERDKQTKAAQRDAEKQQREAQSSLESSLRTVSSNTSTNVSNLTSQKESGELSEPDYLVAKYNETVAGITKRRALLNKAYQDQIIDKQKFNEEIAKLNKETADAGTDYLKGRSQLEEKAFKNALEAIKQGIVSDNKEVEGNLKIRLADIESAYDKQEAFIKKQVANRKLTEQQGEDAIYQLRARRIADTLNAVSAAADTEQQLAQKRIADLRAQGLTEKQIAETLALEKKAIDDAEKKRKEANADAEKKLSGDVADKQIADAKRVADIKKQAEEIYQQAALEAVNGYFTVATDLRNNDMAVLEKQKQNELDLAQNNDTQKAIIEKKYEARQRDIRRRQAVADKQQAIFNIILSTAMAVAKTYAQFGFPTGVPLAIAQAALGAVQLGVALARPIPEFYKGKKDGYEGPGVVGDRGFEIISRQDPKTGKTTYQLAAERQLTYLHKHDRVFTHEESKKMIRVNEGYAQDMRKSSPSLSRQHIKPQPALTTDQLAAAMRSALSDLPVTEHFYDEKGHTTFIRNKNQRIQEMNDYFSLPKKKH